MSAVVNTATSVVLSLYDASGVAVTGKVNTDWTGKIALLITNPATTASVTVTEIDSVNAPGDYRAVFTPTVVGDWRVRATIVVNGDSVPLSGDKSVVTAAQSDPAAALEGFVATVPATVSASTDDLTVRRGDTYQRNLTIADADGTAYDLTGATVWFTVKALPDASVNDDSAVLKLYWVSGGASSGIAVVAPLTGVITVTLTSTQTAALDAGSGYRYDVQTSKGGRIDTPITGRIVVTKDTTIRTTTP